VPRNPEPHWRDRFGCYTFTHRRVRHYLRGVAKGDAAAARARARAILAAADAADLAARDRTVEAVCLGFLAWSARANKPRTTDGHARLLSLFCDFAPGGARYGARPARSITATDLGRMRKAWEAKGHAPGYVAQLYKSVLACWNWAARPEPDRVPERWVDPNPLAGMRRPTVRGRADRSATPAEVAALLRHARARINAPFKVATRGRCMACMAARRPGPCRRSHAATTQMLRETLVLVRLIAATGARPGEACGAKWEGWTPHAGRDGATGQWWGLLRLEHKNERWTGKPKLVPVPPPLVRAIERIRARPGHHPESIFAHRRGRGSAGRGAATAGAGEPWTTSALDARVRKWREGAGLPGGLVLYGLRHAYYSRVAPILGAELAGLIGGTSGGVVRKVYLHARPEALIDAARVARDARGKRGEKPPGQAGGG
jgi:integrase